MKKPLFALGLSLLAAHALAGDMKAGLWEIKTIKQVMDGRDMSAQMAAAQAQMQQQMASLPPEQRKKMESMMGRQGAGATPGAIRICVSEEAAKRDTPIIDPEGQCKPTKMSRSGNTSRYEFDCTIKGRHTVGKGEGTVSGNAINSRMDMTTTDATGRHSMQMESQMTWLGADCRGLAPIGGAAKQK
jgi:hypothetical protein